MVYGHGLINRQTRQRSLGLTRKMGFGRWKGEGEENGPMTLKIKTIYPKKVPRAYENLNPFLTLAHETQKINLKEFLEFRQGR